MRTNPSHTYGSGMGVSDKAKLTKSIRAVYNSAFENTAGISSSDIGEWLSCVELGKGFLLTYTEAKDTNKFEKIKAFLFAEKAITAHDACSFFDVESELDDASVRLSNFLRDVYRLGRYFLDINCFAATMENGERSQRDYAARLFVTFTKDIFLKERPIVYADMWMSAYRLLSEDRLKKIKYTMVYDQQEVDEDDDIFTQNVILVPNELFDDLGMSKEDIRLIFSSVLDTSGDDSSENLSFKFVGSKKESSEQDDNDYDDLDDKYLN